MSPEQSTPSGAALAPAAATQTQDDQFAFELLALDPDAKAACSERDSTMVYAIASSGLLWNKANVDSENCTITQDSARLTVTRVPVPADPVADAGRADRSYLVHLCGAPHEVEWRRAPLADVLTGMPVQVYVLTDDVSEHIARQLYAGLYRVENLLRRYIVRFMTAQFGRDWLSVSLPPEKTKVITDRRGNLKGLGKIERDPFLIDFGDLGEIIYRQSSGFLTREDILRRVNATPETAEAFQALKKALQSNYQKFFKDAFRDREFEAKWREFEELRRRIAHCSLFTADDLNLGLRLTREIEDIITNAESLLATVEVSPSEREAIDAQIEQVRPEARQDAQALGAPLQKRIREDEFLHELRLQQAYFSMLGGFVGLSRFYERLDGLGFEYGATRRMVEDLKASGGIEIYSVPNPYGEYPTAAIRLTAQP